MDEHTQLILAGLAHDLRTPLAAISGYTDLLRVGVHGPLLPKQLDSLDRIRTNHLRMAELIADMMEYVEAVSGTQRMFLESIDLLAVITDATAALAARATRCNVTIVLDEDFPPDAGPLTATRCDSHTVIADRVALDSVIRGILRDTIDSSAGGIVTIRPSRTGETAVITFEVGVHPLDEAACRALFMPFDREAGERRPTGSSALVLPRARMLARAFGGEVMAVPDPHQRILRIHVAAHREATLAISET